MSLPLTAWVRRVPPQVWKTLFWLGTALVLYLTLRPASPHPAWFPWLDKLEHATAFAMLAALGLQAGWRGRWKLGLALVALGVAIELLQKLTATRQAEVADAVADAAGVLLVLWLWPTPGRPSGGQPEEDRR